MVVGGRQEGVEPVRYIVVADLVVSLSLLSERFTVSIDGRLHSLAGSIERSLRSFGLTFCDVDFGT